GEAGVALLLDLPDGVAGVALEHLGGDRQAVDAGPAGDLDGGVGVGHEVVVPVGVVRGAGLGGEHGVAAVDRLVHHRRESLLARRGARAVQDQHRGALEVAADVAAVGAELVDDLGVPVGVLGHGGYLARVGFDGGDGPTRLGRGGIDPEAGRTPT